MPYVYHDGFGVDRMFMEFNIMPMMRLSVVMLNPIGCKTTSERHGHIFSFYYVTDGCV